MKINDRAPAVGMAESIVAAPVDIVRDVLCDLPNCPSWNKSVSKLGLRGDFRPGTSFVWGAGGSKIVSRLDEIERPRRIVWTGRTLGIVRGPDCSLFPWTHAEHAGSRPAAGHRGAQGRGALPPRPAGGLMRRQLMLEAPICQTATGKQ